MPVLSLPPTTPVRPPGLAPPQIPLPMPPASPNRIPGLPPLIGEPTGPAPGPDGVLGGLLGGYAAGAILASPEGVAAAPFVAAFGAGFAIGSAGVFGVNQLFPDFPEPPPSSIPAQPLNSGKFKFGTYTVGLLRVSLSNANGDTYDIHFTEKLAPTGLICTDEFPAFTVKKPNSACTYDGFETEIRDHFGNSTKSKYPCAISFVSTATPLPTKPGNDSGSPAPTQPSEGFAAPPAPPSPSVPDTAPPPLLPNPLPGGIPTITPFSPKRGTPANPTPPPEPEPAPAPKPPAEPEPAPQIFPPSEPSPAPEPTPAPTPTPPPTPTPTPTPSPTPSPAPAPSPQPNPPAEPIPPVPAPAPSPTPSPAPQPSPPPIIFPLTPTFPTPATDPERKPVPKPVTPVVPVPGTVPAPTDPVKPVPITPPNPAPKPAPDPSKPTQPEQPDRPQKPDTPVVPTPVVPSSPVTPPTPVPPIVNPPRRFDPAQDFPNGGGDPQGIKDFLNGGAGLGIPGITPPAPTPPNSGVPPVAPAAPATPPPPLVPSGTPAGVPTVIPTVVPSIPPGVKQIPLPPGFPITQNPTTGTIVPVTPDNPLDPCKGGSIDPCTGQISFKASQAAENSAAAAAAAAGAANALMLVPTTFKQFDKCDNGTATYKTNVIAVPRNMIFMAQSLFEELAFVRGAFCEQQNAVATMPEWWQVRNEGGTPQLVLSYVEVLIDGTLGNDRYPITIPHPKSTGKPTGALTRDYLKGNWLIVLTLKDNSKVILNSKTEAEGLNFIKDVIKPLIDPAFITDAKIKTSHYPDQGFKEMKVRNKYVDYYATGNRNLKPKWRARV